jgi:hypothetical protein
MRSVEALINHQLLPDMRHGRHHVVAYVFHLNNLRIAFDEAENFACRYLRLHQISAPSVGAPQDVKGREARRKDGAVGCGGEGTA